MVEIDAHGQPANHWTLCDQLSRLTGSPLQIFTDDQTFWQSLIHPEDRPHVLEKLARLATLETSEAEYRLVAAGGDVIWVRDARYIRRDVDHPPLVYGVISDITAHRQAEEALRRANRAYRTLTDCNQTMVRANDEPGLLNAICQTIVRSGGYRMAWVGYRSDSPADALQPVAWAGHEAGYFAAVAFENCNVPDDHRPTAQALSAARPVIVPDIAAAPVRWQNEALQRGFRSAIILPLVMENDAFGVLTVYADEPDAFDPEEVTLLSELAGDLAYGIAALRNRRERELAEEKLRQSEYNIRALVENTQDMIWSVDTHMQLVTMNHRFSQLVEALFGFAPQIGRSNLRFLPDDERDFWEGAYERALRGDRFTVERSYTTASGAIVLEIALNPILSDAGEVTGIVLFARDITERRQKEAALHQLNARLLKHNEELTALNEAGRELTATLDPQTIYRVLHQTVARRLYSAPHFQIMLYDDASQTLACVYAVMNGVEVDPAQFPPMPLGEGPASEAVLARETRITAPSPQDDERDLMARFGRTASAARPLSAIYAPMISSDQVIGVIAVQQDEANAFDQADVTLLSIVANQAANTIHNAQLFAAKQRHAAELEAQTYRLNLINRISTRLAQTLERREIYAIALTELGAMLKTSYAGLVLFEDEFTGRLVLDTHPSQAGQRDVIIPLKDNPSIEIVRRTHKPLVSEDVLNDPAFEPVWEVLRARGTRSLIIAPLVVGDEVIGTIGLDATEPRGFTPVEIELTETIANQVSLAVAKAQLYEAEREQRSLAEALRDTAQIMNSTLDFDEVLDRILANISRVVPHDTADIMLIEEGIARIVRSYPPLHKDPLRGWKQALRFEVDRVDNLRTMVETRRPLIIPDTRQYPGWIRLPQMDWLRSQAAAPIIQGDQVIGFLTLDSSTPGFFSPKQGERLQAFADQAAVALENAQLFQAVQQHLAELDALRRITLDITGQLELDSLLKVVVERAMGLLGGQSGGVYLVREDLNVLEWVVKVGPTPTAIGTQLEYGEGLSGQVWKQDRALIVHDYGEWQGRAAFFDPDYHLSSVAGAPIKWGEEFLGVIVVEALVEHGNRRFTEGDAHLLSLLASQAAIAIKNARLFEQIHSHAAQLEQRVRERTAELESQRQQLQTILDTLGEGVMYSVGSQTVYTNQAYCDLFGFDAETVLAHSKDVHDHIFGLVEDTERLQKMIDMSFKRGESWRGDLRLRRKDGSAFDAAMTTTQVPGGESDEPRGVVTIFRDISQQKALQDQKDRFIASASHELRTPLANVKTRLYLIRCQPDQLEHHLDILERVVDNMTELIENLLDVSRFERGIIPLRRQSVTLQDLIAEVVAIQQPEAEKKEVTLVTRLPAGPLTASVDPKRMAQVITNLIVNAINYTPVNGQIAIEMERDGSQAVIRVRDTGIGIDSDTLEHVFEPFFRANQIAAGGAGLGLTIAREIVTLHGGDLTAASKLGQGSTFTVKLDLEEAD